MHAAPVFIAILDDDSDVACAAQLLLRRRYARVLTFSSPAQLLDLIAADTPDVVLLDLNFTAGRIDGTEGLAVLDRLRALVRAPEVIALTAYADVPLAVKALKRGASDFITKPWDNAHLIAAVDSALARRQSTQAPSAVTNELMGQSRVMQSLRSMIASVAPTEANVLILGENGVGKELVAQALHRASHRAQMAFMAVDMGALPEATFESELFGHRKGAFTNANRDRPGRFQATRGGTLFLDEIGNTPLAAQAKLLTALERREVTPLGADQPEAIDVRVISATNLDEQRLFDPRVFRPDLLFRLNTIVLRIAPLRERSEDIPELLRHYLDLYQTQYQRPPRSIAAAALEQLCRYPWPGNVRALRHACERAVILGQQAQYAIADFGLSAAPTSFEGEPNREPIQAQPEAVGVTAPAGQTTLALSTIERAAIARALEQAQGNITQAAKTLGVSRAALYRKLEKHDL